MKLTRLLLAIIVPVLLLLLLLSSIAARAAESQYRQCNAGDTACQIGEFLYDDDYVAVPPANASCTLSVRDPSGTPLAGSPFAMSETADGWYSHNFDTTGQTNGLYRSNMCCTITTPSQTLCLDKSFTIGPSTEDAVLDADLSGHTTAGTLGWYLQNPLGLVKDIWEYSTRSLNEFTDLVTAVWNGVTRSLTTRSIAPGENIAQEETLQQRWTSTFAGDGEVLAGQTYRATLWLLNFESNFANANTNPSYTIYDSMLNSVASGTMTATATGVYDLTYAIPGSATGGRYKTVVNIDVDGGGTDIQDGSYWEVESSPAQVTINAITDNTVPSIVANVTITNEGGSGYEYKYSYCVVDSESNPCGGGDDVYYNSGSKFLGVGQSWIKNFTANVPNPGDYWFKVVVQWGTERSGATQAFTATTVACLGDYNSDGWVDLTDFSIMLFYWNQHNPAHDLSGDGYVNLTDFSILLFHWGKCP